MADKIALAKRRRERAISAAQEKQSNTWKAADERMRFNEVMGSNVASASVPTPDQAGRFYEASGIDQAPSFTEGIKGEIINTYLSFLQGANKLGNLSPGGPSGFQQRTNAGLLGRDWVARGAGKVLGTIIPGITGQYSDSQKAQDIITQWGKGNITKGDVANIILSGPATRAVGISAKAGYKPTKALVESVRASGIPIMRGTKAGQATATQSNILADLAAAKEAGLVRSKATDSTKAVGTPGYTAMDEGKPVGTRAKLKASDQGNDLRVYNEVYLMRDRLRSANERAQKFGAGIINVTSKISRREIRKAIEQARREYPDVWNAKGLDGFDLSHITPLEKGGKNAWSNLKLMPTEANLDQSIAPFSAWRYLTDPEKLAAYGARGKGLGIYAVGQ